MTSPPIPVHMTLCGKGGVGKSVTARLLTEYLIDQGQDPMAFDADPVNASFAAVTAFGVERVDLIDADHKVNARLFDEIVLKITQSGRPVVIDTGASSYVPLMNYMRELDLADMLEREGYALYCHALIAGGPSLAFTLENLDDVCRSFGDRAGIVVWLNHFWETIERHGRPFLDWPIYREHAGCIRAVLEIQRMASDTSATDFALLLKDNRSFAEVDVQNSPYNLVTRARLRRIRSTIFDGIDAVFRAQGLIGQPESLEVVQ